MKMSKLTLSIAIAILFVLLVAGTALADSSVGALQAAFNTWGNAVDTIEWNVPNEVAVVHAAPNTGLEGRISPFAEGQVFCDDQVLGLWVIHYDREDFAEDMPRIVNEFTLDGEVLKLKRTPIKVAFPTYKDEEGYKYLWFAEGVPVLGTLEVGTHLSEFTVSLDGESYYFPTFFEVVECGE